MIQRPKSIALFQLFYSAYALVGFGGSYLALTRNAEIQAINVDGGGWLIPVSLVAPLLIAALIWFFVVRQASQVAAWIATLLFVINLAASAVALLRWQDGAADGVALALGLVATFFFLLAVIMLWRGETLAWFSTARTKGRV
ncbi:hypothetical protein [Sphingomonas sp.]|uniref:hypothetical protein n=1 Tax=Sphingomonas sp. TaxID=28214 RepID=UPI0025F43350|nr:hypothetical protein [Sphingomonas sp.]